jgi:hypothetical protein
MLKYLRLAIVWMGLSTALLLQQSVADDGAVADVGQTFDKETVLGEATSYFGASAEGIASVIEKVFSERGEPVGFIRGREAGGAIIVGLRYGDGELVMSDGFTSELHWQGPSFGFDFGGNASKVFVLVYNLSSVDDIFQRFPGVDGSLYFVGGAGVNYVKRDEITLAPIRVGLGWRAGASVGYMKITQSKSWNPF